MATIINKKISIIFLLLFLLIVFSIFFFLQRKAFLEISFEPKEINLKINEKEYLNINNFNKKINPGKHEIEISKENYKTHKETLTLKPGEKIILTITLSVDPEIEKEVKEKIGGKEDYEINIIRTKQGYLEAIKKSPDIKRINAEIFILKKINNKWEILDSGTGVEIEKFIIEELTKTLPHREDSFEVSYLDTEDTFLVIIKKEPARETMGKVKKWFWEQGLDPNYIPINWVSIEGSN